MAKPDRRFAHPEIAAFWQRFLQDNPNRDDADARFLETFRVGDSAESANQGARLILSGQKTATSSLIWALEADGAVAPKAGDLSILLDGSDSPVSVIETTETRIIPLNAVDARIAHAYGEWDRTLETWRARTFDHYAAECRRIGRKPAPDMLLLCEWFRIIHTAD